MADRAEDMYIEADGKRIWIGRLQLDGTDRLQISDLSIVHGAIINYGGEGVINVQSGDIGISGDNYVHFKVYGSGMAQTSGAAVSGNYVQVVAAGA
jgi:hypothetical protein